MGLEKTGSARSSVQGRVSPPLLPRRAGSGRPRPAASAHRPARPLPGAVLKLPIWGDAAAENCFEDDVYWEVRRGAGDRRGGADGQAGGRGPRRGSGPRPAAQDGAVAPRREGPPRRGAEQALPQVPEDEESDVYHMHNPDKPAAP